MCAERSVSRSRRGDVLFFAVMPDASAAWSMAEIGRDLRLKHGLTGRLVARRYLHLPLIGFDIPADVSPGLVRLAMQTAAAIRMPPFEVVLDQARSLAGLRRPLVLYGNEGVRGARELQRAIEIAMEELAIGAAGRRHMPHVTVLDGWRGTVEEAIEPVRWTVTEFVLLCRLRGRHESVVLGRWTLSADTGRPSGFEEPTIAIGW
jgi:2'-5' RNA ligase